MVRRRVVALGGGGFSMEADNPLLDDYVLSFADADKPRVCFLPTASGDANGYVERFLDAFPSSRADTTVVGLFRREHKDLRSLLLSQDVVYVGGGNTVSMLAVWRSHGVDVILREAYEAGVVMAGISAGMNCWFEASVTDSFTVDELNPLRDGLGWLTGSACPHYDGEAQRRPTLLSLVAEGFPPGYAVDDSAALSFADEQLEEAVSSVRGASAFRVALTPQGVVEEPLRVRYLGDQDRFDHI